MLKYSGLKLRKAKPKRILKIKGNSEQTIGVYYPHNYIQENNINRELLLANRKKRNIDDDDDDNISIIDILSLNKKIKLTNNTHTLQEQEQQQQQQQTINNILKIDNNFLNSLKYELPFRVKVYNERSYYVLENPIFCQIFWIKFIHDKVAAAFQRQFILTYGEGDKMDLSVQVWIDRNTLELYKPPTFIRIVAYFNEMIDAPDSVAFLKWKSKDIRNIGILSLLAVGILSLITPTIL